MKKTVFAIMMSVALATPVLADEMGHGSMDHGKMDHAKMDHSQMGSDKMDHAGMSMAGMSAVGMPAQGAKPDKVVHVLLSDDMKIRFKKEVDIEPDDIVQFVVMNVGKIDHEFSIGSMEEQLKHREMMRQMTAGHDHDSGSTVTVKPGQAKQLLWHFHGEPSVEFACNIPGHAEAGMVKSVMVQ
ncbi:copper-binding protein [Photobacterium sp. 1_MG-2023]|uniref:copper-resistant cuproprotein CopI n=1 Tax=Photobacterium sp. 1_MG-2023 TaxID=3062646 RepID=UPI0026E13586|nr:copper-binding protein [Photobacterium sp. 1_MG-2023]MDO6708950.1 copper-binding protein [Photobacterium sp. 1_MG-2023]